MNGQNNRFLQEALNSKMDDEEKKVHNLLGKIAGGLAHEIKNPLSTMKINLQLMDEFMKNPANIREEKIKNKIKIILTEINRLENTVNNFLKFAGKIQLYKDEVNVNELISSILDFMFPLGEAGKIAVHTQFDNKIGIVSLDENLIKQAIFNLLINAEEAIREDGEIIVKTKKDDSNLVLEFTDTGIGMPDDVKQKVFDAYFSDKQKGTGIGLSITKKIIEAHGGTIKLESTPGKGTNFIISIPIQ